ncbi:MAG: NUDIX hydrolase [Candidatus Pacebacteria bacterium]|nr:NUDIX hydrolase [Candidatus Paceibacterota bacterium]
MGNIERPKSKQPIPEHAKKVFSGVLFDVYQWEQELYDGTKATFEKLKRPDTVVVFPVLDNGEILLTEQEQPGKEGSFISGAGGRVDQNEDILDAAKRELLEETGYEANEFYLWDAQQPSSKLEWAVYTFIAKGVKKVAELNPDAGEKIKLKPVKFGEFLDMATEKKFLEKEVVGKLFEAKLDPKKLEELRELFKPN